MLLHPFHPFVICHRTVTRGVVATKGHLEIMSALASTQVFRLANSSPLEFRYEELGDPKDGLVSRRRLI